MATSNPPSESAYHREYFCVGGTWTKDTSTTMGGYVFNDQMYVERLTPTGGAKRPFPLIMVHGAAHSGSCWLHTPDGRKGWASYFLDQGYVVYVVDTASRGRSPHVSGEAHVRYPTGFVENFFTAPKDVLKWPQAALHTQWPGTGRKGCPIFDGYYASLLPSQFDLEQEQLTNQAAGAALLNHIGKPCIIITHSQGAPTGWLMADMCPQLVKAIVAIEPNGPPFQGSHIHSGLPARPWGLTEAPMTYSPPITDPSEFHLVTIPATEEGMDAMVLQDETVGTVRKWANFKDIPVLVEMGEASYHAPYDHCTVEFLRQVGVTVDFLRLQDRGISGNGHMQMLELNNLEIAEVLDEWIRGKVE